MKKMLFIFMLIVGTTGFARDDFESNRGQGSNDFERFQYEENYKDEQLAEEVRMERMSRMRFFKEEEKPEQTYNSAELFLRSKNRDER